MRSPPITVAVKGHQPLDEAGLAALIASLPGLSLMPLTASPPPHILVWDAASSEPASLPPNAPETALLFLIGNPERVTLPPGVAGLFSKEESPEALGVAIRQVARGEQYLSPSLALALLKSRKTEMPPPATDLSNLTEREREILALLAEGLSNKAIAARLYLSVRTVEGHLVKLYERLGVHSRVEAVLIAIRHVQSQATSGENKLP